MENEPNPLEAPEMDDGRSPEGAGAENGPEARGVQEEPVCPGDQMGDASHPAIPADEPGAGSPEADAKTDTPEGEDAVEPNAPQDNKKRRSLILKVAAGALLVIAAVAYLGSAVFPSAEDLGVTLTVNGLSIDSPSSWDFEESTHGYSYRKGKDWLTTVDIISTSIDTPLVGESGAPAFDELRRGLRLSPDTDVDYGIEETEIDGWPAIRYEYTEEKDGTEILHRGVAVLAGAKSTMVKTRVPIESQKDALTIGSMLETVEVDVPTHKVTFVDENGEEFGGTIACDHGNGAYAVLPAVIEESGLLASEWKCIEGVGDIELDEDGTAILYDVKTGVTLSARLSKYWTVTFTDGQGETLDEARVPEDGAATAPDDPIRDGYIFAGWDADFSAVTQDLTVNALWKEKPRIYSAGSYRVGTDIPAGEYKITCIGSHAYYCVYPDTSKSDILSNGNFTTCTYVSVSDGQLLEVKGSSFVRADSATPSTAFSGQGIYKVGFDIQPGEYNITASESSGGYYAVLSTVDANTPFNIVDNDNFEGNSFVSVRDGQYLEISRASIDIE